MTRQAESASVTRDRRSGSRDLITKLTDERTEMLVLFCRLAGVNIYGQGEGASAKKTNYASAQKLLQKFCQVLVDYIAAGHFSLYERIVNGNERRRQVATFAEGLYPKIAESTQIALDFNDKYDCEDHCEIPDDFEEELSRLGQALAARIELEDKLLRVYF